ncbi:MAG: IS3 family transposase, partial [Candidatus Tenebribacter mawsonii]|nr:IS3 family transposase [Candidatus Tenebribacter mawsonii]
KPYKSKCNDENISNVIDRNFKPGLTQNVIVSDLTYVKVGVNWFNNHRIHGSLGYLSPIEYKTRLSE